MLSVADVLGHVAQEMRNYTTIRDEAAIEEFLTGTSFEFHLAITTNVEETEEDFMDQYGKGHTFYFRLSDYDHGKRLAGQIYYILLGHEPDMSMHTGQQFLADEKLYFFLHLSNIDPAKA